MITLREHYLFNPQKYNNFMLQRIIQTGYFLLAITFSCVLASCGGSGSGDNQIIEIAPPVLVLRSVTGDSITTNQSSLPVIGTTSPTATVIVNGNSVSVDGSGNFSTTVTLSSGINTVTVTADLNGLQTTLLFSAILQQNPPSLTVISPAATLSTNDSALLVTGTAGLVDIDVWVNGDLQTLTSGNFSTTVTLTSGANLVYIVALDAAGNEATVERTVILDQSQPLLAISSPENGTSTYIEPLLVVGETEPGATVTVNGNPVVLSPSGGSLDSFSEMLSAYEASSSIEVVATDPAGNSTTINLTVNRLAEPGTLYVANTHPNAVDSPSCGTPILPCLTISQGFSRAATTSAPQVLVGSGIYQEKVVLLNGVDLLGGFDENFTVRNLAALKAEIWGDGTSRSVVADGITVSTLLEGFVIRGPVMVSPTSNSTALYIKDSGSSFVVQNNIIIAGRGADGVNGADGSSGKAGSDGSVGVIGVETGLNPCLISDLNDGGSGGVLIVSANNLSGGNGGGNIACADGSTIEVSAGDGQNGNSAGGLHGIAGTGGDAGDDGEIVLLSSSTVCLLPVNPAIGQDGASGQSGFDGTAASGATGSSIVNHTWLGTNGSVGDPGGHGGGGAGGGAGGGSKCSSGSCTSDTLGGSGGGGGAGGERGQGGEAGTFGGSSFGVFISFTVTPTNIPLIAGNEIVPGVAGSGGHGGSGGIGGDAGFGSIGGSGAASEFCTWSGGSGAAGGSGGHGGGGGGGTGGISTGFFINFVGFSGGYSYDIDNNFVNTGLAGVGGKGGYSPGNSGSAGSSGSINEVLTKP